MKYSVIIRHIGLIIAIVGLAMLAPVHISLINREPYVPVWIGIAAATTVLGLVLFLAVRVRETIGYREGFAMVTFAWVAATLFGALPFWMTGAIPGFADAFFESMSGFSTTGASILTDIESLPRSLLFWRSLTHWLGGMGIMVLFVALLSQLGAGGMQVFRAEAPGPITEKIKPRISETAKILWLTYVILTLAETLLLRIAGLDWFDSLTHTFGTMATGGFSTKNLSVGAFQNPAVEWIIIVFMFAAGTNFALYYTAVKKKSLKNFWHNEEFKLYTSITLGAILIIWLILAAEHGFFKAARLASFQVVSIITTTGYATDDYVLWPSMATGVLFLLMFVGGSAGSTGGGMKVSRYLVLLKHSGLQLKKFFHPRAVFSLKVGGKSYPEDIIISIFQFFFFYIFMVITGTVIMTGFGLEIKSAVSAVLATLGNIGPGFGAVGPMENYAFLPDAAKYLLSFFMLVGRLEIFTVLVLLLPSFWRK
ncbi:TrkH family potassium uptake protein [Phosphitispora fastidiosa]|uniref:TrkH family potassium uptake protein n=1 Tax=Phosphitispora fastidiosa TaxID=2837202 RepID=UPI001E4C4C2C|nr:potassium transporter TrkG [Phosphitispora fastidiosa]MBU7007124.1 trk system potassium uptake protein TrkH [Phosphitispora fastidiosa]